jgi:hypothetical protein
VTGAHSCTARARLLQGLRGEGEKGLPEADWTELVDLAQKHGVTPLLHRGLKARYADLEVPAPIQSRLRDAYRAAGIRNTRLFARLHGILKRFRDAGIDVVVLKGAHLAELVYEEVALRPMADVDLLVRAGDLRAATRLLREFGYEQPGQEGSGSPRHQEPIQEHMEIESFRKPGGLLLDIHYSVFIPGQADKASIESVWCRVRAVRIGGAEALVLSPEDLLLHLCVHAALNHGFDVRLVNVCDVPMVVDRYGDSFDWTTFWARSREWGAERAALVTFALAEKLLGWRRPPASQTSAGLPPAVFDVVSVSERLLFSESPTFTLFPQMAKLWGDGTLIEKARLVRDRVFVSRRELGFTYGVPADSPRALLCYAVRFRTLVARAMKKAIDVSRDRQVAEASLDSEKERSRLVEWLGDR